jgi:putative ABC transport system permease protein
VINLIGLSSGLTCALLIFLWVQDEMGVDKFHENDNRLYQVREKVEFPHMTLASRSMSGPLEEGWRADLPEVEYIVATSRNDEAILSMGENNVKGTYMYTGKDFFQVFSFRLIHGHKYNVLNDKNSVVISQDMAGKLFPELDNVVGQTVKFDREKDYIISGVFETISKQSTQQFDFVLPLAVFQDQQKGRWNWSWHNLRAFVLLRPGVEVTVFNEKIENYRQVKTNDEIKNRKPFVTSFSDTYLYGEYENGVQEGGRIEYVRLFSIIAIFILFIACINFMNLSTARASIRIKEVGIKKTLGVRKKTLIVQYLAESLVLTIISLVIALLLTFICLPEFNVLTEKQLSLVFDGNMMLGLLSIVIITGVAAGAYPAFYLSGFSPAAVLQGKLNISLGEIWVRRGLVVFQFVLTIILVSSVLVVYQQLEMMQSKNLGYDKDQIIQFKREGKLKTPKGMETFLDEMRNIPGVSNASGLSRTLIGRSSVAFPKWEGQPSDDKTFFAIMRVNYDFIETVGIEIKEGRTFSKSYSSDNSVVILNEEAIKTMGLKDPIGKTVKLGRSNCKIIGVTKDFHLASLHKKVEPLLFIEVSS